MFFTVSLVSAAVKIYPAPAGLKPSDAYTVYVNGESVFVYDSPIPAAFCSFDMNGAVDIVIKANRDIKWVDVRPLAAGIIPVFKDSTIKLHLEKPVQLSIELNGTLKLPLFIFANSFETNIPSGIDKHVLFFKAGKMYHPGIIQLHDNETLYIEGGAYVTAVIDAAHAKNIRVCGRGVLNGTYNNDFDTALIMSGQFPAQKKEEGKNYHVFFNLVDCENVTIEGLTMVNCTSWDVVPTHCNNVHISNIKIVSDNGSDDGIDIVRCRNVLVERSFIRTKDDCIAIKATDGYPKAEGVDSILVRNCVFWNGMWGNGLEIGFELNSSLLQHISFINNDIIHVEAGATLSIHNAGTATVRNILFDNIRIEDSRQKLFDFAIFRSRYSEDGVESEEEKQQLYLNGAWDGVLTVPQDQKPAHARYRGRIENITLRNIQVTGGIFPFSIFYGYDKDHGISNVLIENLSVYGKKITNIQNAKIYLENTTGISIH